jgi:hypothetical protein
MNISYTGIDEDNEPYFQAPRLSDALSSERHPHPFSAFTLQLSTFLINQQLPKGIYSGQILRFRESELMKIESLTLDQLYPQGTSVIVYGDTIW